MDDKIFAYIQEQIEFLKKGIDIDIPLSMDFEYQATSLASIVGQREETKREILKLLNRLLDINGQKDNNQYLRNTLEKVLSDNSVAQSAINAVSELETEDKAEMIGDIASNYEFTKKDIAKQILEKMG